MRKKIVWILLAAIVATVTAAAGLADTLTDAAARFLAGEADRDAMIEAVTGSDCPAPYAYLEAGESASVPFSPDSEILRICGMRSRVDRLNTVVFDCEHGIALGGFDCFLQDMTLCTKVSGISEEDRADFRALLDEIETSEAPVESWQPHYLGTDEDDSEGFYSILVIETTDGLYRFVQDGSNVELPDGLNRLRALLFEKYLYWASAEEMLETEG